MKKPSIPCILAVNGGSSSIKFSLFESDETLKEILSGSIQGIGMSTGNFTVAGTLKSDNLSREVPVPDCAFAVRLLMHWLDGRVGSCRLIAVGHRVVHGGPTYWEPRRITQEMIAELGRLRSFDPEHLPEEILLIDAFQKRFSEVPQIACFDTAFHHDMPRVAQMLPIPRRYEIKGLRRYGFHGLSYSYLMEELTRLDPVAARGRVILAHLGSGASMAAVYEGKCIDTSMAFTPAAGLVMGTRTGDIDPGLLSFLARSENITAPQFDRMVNHESGLLGVSETSSDMRELLKLEAADFRAAEAVTLFCYQARKWIGSFAAALGGVETLVFAGGIGENSPVVRARICERLGFLGMELNESHNAKSAGVISSKEGRVSIRVIHTNEELMIARSVACVLGNRQE